MRNDSLKRTSINSTIWKLSERLLAQGVTLIVSIVLARLLDPKDYSIVGVITIFFNFANLLISGGLNTALVQKKDADQKDYSTVFTSSIILSIIVYFVLFFTATPISRLYDQSILILAIRIMGLTLPINAIKAVYCAKVSSELQFKKFFWATLGGTIASAFVGLTMANNGCGVWSLIAQNMTNIFIDTAVLAISVPLTLKFKIYKERLSRLLSYGWKILVSSLIGALYTELNPLIIGIKFSPTDLSYYTKGRSFPGLISTVSSNTFAAVLFPVLSKCQDDREKLLNCTRIYVRMSSFVALPLMIGLMFAADNFIVLLLTEKWLPAVPYLKIFCVAFVFDMINIGNCEAIKALGRSDIYLLIEIIKKALYFVIIGFFFFLSNNPVALTVSFVFCAVVSLIVNSVPNIFLLGYTVKKQMSDLVPNLLLALIMGGIVYLIGNLDIAASAGVVLCIQILCGMISYILLGVLTRNMSLFYTLSTLKEYLKKAK